MIWPLLKCLHSLSDRFISFIQLVSLTSTNITLGKQRQIQYKYKFNTLNQFQISCLHHLSWNYKKQSLPGHETACQLVVELILSCQQLRGRVMYEKLLWFPNTYKKNPSNCVMEKSRKHQRKLQLGKKGTTALNKHKITVVALAHWRMLKHEKRLMTHRNGDSFVANYYLITLLVLWKYLYI